MSGSFMLHSNEPEERQARWVPYHRPLRRAEYAPLPPIQRVSERMLEEIGLTENCERVRNTSTDRLSHSRVDRFPLLGPGDHEQVDLSPQGQASSRTRDDDTRVNLPATNAWSFEEGDDTGYSVHSNRRSSANTTLDIIAIAESSVEVVEEDRHMPALKRNLWSPLCLRWYTIFGFVVVFVSLLISTVILFCYSKAHNGLVTVESGYYYLWTYGPTAVFILLSTFWSQVEYRTLQLMPWKLMSKGFVSADNCVLLDYVSDWNVWALCRSLKRKHFEVALVITISLLLKLITVFSTGLFTTAVLPSTSNTTFTLLNEFSNGQFNQSTVDAGPYIKSRALRQGDIRAIPGVTEDYTYESFYHDTDKDGSPIYLSQHQYSSEVNVFDSNLDCEEAQVIGKNDNFSLSIRTANCGIDSIETSGYWTQFARAYLATCDGVKSEVGFNRSIDYQPDRDIDVNALDWKLWIYIGANATWGSGQQVNWLWKDNNTHTQWYHFTALMCTARYNITRRVITYAGSSDNTSPSISIAPDRSTSIFNLVNVRPSNLLYATYLSVSRAMAPSEPTFPEPGEALLGLESFTEIPIVLNSTIARNQATANFRYVAAQTARDYFMKSTSRSVSGMLTAAEDRLVLRNTTMIIVSSLLGAIALLASIFSVFYIQFDVCSRDPGSIAGFATILSQSPQLRDSLYRTGSAPNEVLEKALASMHYSTTSDQATFAIVQEPESDIELPTILPNNEIQWWRPISASSWMRATVLTAPVLIIILLEILCQLSNRRHGVFAGSTNSFVNSLPLYVPALVLFGIRTLFEMVYFAARIFQPYHNLKIGRAQPANSITDTQHRHVAITGFWRALRQNQWAVMTASLSILLGPFLPIAAAGLYVTKPVTATKDATLIQSNRLQLDRLISVLGTSRDSRQDHWLGDSVLEFNASYPRWTYQDLSFPTLEMMDGDLSVHGFTNTTSPEGFSLQANLSAIYVSTLCESVPKDSFAIGFSKSRTSLSPNGTQSNPNAMVNLTSWRDSTPQLCRPVLQPSYIVSPPGPLGYFNTFVPLQSSNRTTQPSEGCPGFVTIFGQMGSEFEQVGNYTVIKCWPRIQQSQFEVRLTLPNYDLQVLSLSDRNVNSTVISQNCYATGFCDPKFMDPDWVSVLLVNREFGDNTTASLDRMFQSIVHGLNPTNVEDLFNPDILQQKINHTTAIVFAQLVNAYGRTNWSTNASRSDYPTLVGELTGPAGSRIVQSEVSTRVLQAILAAMTVCGAVSIVLVDTRAVLPKNPLSIAAMASLLADSKMLKTDMNGANLTIPAWAEWCDDKELHRPGIFEGRTYAMGWWNSDGARLDDHQLKKSYRCWFQVWMWVGGKMNNNGPTKNLKGSTEKNKVRFAVSCEDVIENNLDHAGGTEELRPALHDTNIIETVSDIDRHSSHEAKYFAIDFELE